MELRRFTIDIPDKPGYWVTVYSAEFMYDHYFTEIDDWVRLHRLGKRMAFNEWKFKNEQSRNWFILKWS